MSGRIPIKFLNNEGGGYAENCELESETSVAQFLMNKGIAANTYKIRLRRKGADGEVRSETPTADTVLEEGDFLSCVPLKAEGAAALIRAAY